MADLDNILSGAGAAASEPEVKEETPAVVEQAQAEQATEQNEEAPDDTGQQEGEQGQKMVPQQALHAEKQKVKRYTEEVADLRGIISKQASDFQRDIAELKAMLTAKPAAPEAKAEKKGFWDFDDPDQYVQATIQSNMAPFSEQTAAIREELAEHRYNVSYSLALGTYGADAINAADKAVKDAVASGVLNGETVRQELQNSRDPVGDIVRWHKNSPAMKEQELREKLRAELLEEMQGGGQQAQAQQPGKPAVGQMPSNLAGARNVASRAGPAWSGPPPLTDIFAR